MIHIHGFLYLTPSKNTWKSRLNKVKIKSYFHLLKIDLIKKNIHYIYIYILYYTIFINIL